MARVAISNPYTFILGYYDKNRSYSADLTYNPPTPTDGIYWSGNGLFRQNFTVPANVTRVLATARNGMGTATNVVGVTTGKTYDIQYNSNFTGGRNYVYIKPYGPGPGWATAPVGGSEIGHASIEWSPAIEQMAITLEDY